MKHSIRALTICLLCSASCRGPGTPRDASLNALRPEEHTKSLSAKQTADMKVMLGRSLEQQGEVDKAMAAYHEAIQLDRNRADAYMGLAILQDKQGRFRESEELYQKALKSDPANPDIFCDRGYSLYLQHRWADAEMNLRQAIALKPDHERAHNNLGLVMAHTGRSDPALVEFRKAGCDVAGAHANLAFCLLADARLEEAHKQYELALLADPTSRLALKGIRQVDSLIAKTIPNNPLIEQQDGGVLQLTDKTATLPSDSLQSVQPAHHVPSSSQSRTVNEQTSEQ